MATTSGRGRMGGWSWKWFVKVCVLERIGTYALGVGDATEVEIPDNPARG